MANLNIQNNQSQNTEKKKSFRLIGKEEYKKYCEVKLKKSTDLKTLFFGLIITLVVVFPFLLILIQLFQAYLYNLNLRLLFICIAWGILLLCNGLSNYFTIKLAKLYYPEDTKLMSVNEKAVMYFQTLNFGFMIFTFVLLIFVFLGSMSV